MSGDSDYIDLVKHLKGEGVRVEICAVEETTAQALVEVAEFFHPIVTDDIFTYTAPKGTKSKSRPRKK